MYKVGVITIDGFALMSYASVVEPLRAANLLKQKVLYEIINITLSKAGAQSSSGISVCGDKLVGDNVQLDLLLVIAGGDPFLIEETTLFNWLRKMAAFGTLIGGVSGGPVLLVKAGLMRDRRMTVHWEHLEGLTELTSSTVVEKSLYVMDRDRMTCAGGTAPMDMMLALISSRDGATFARFVSDWFLHSEIRPSGVAQRAKLADRVGCNNPLVLAAVQLMENHIADPLSLTQLASLVEICNRQLNRLFKKNLGKSTMNYYRSIRVEKARNLLRNSPLNVSEIAEATGFANPSHLSGVFSSTYGYPPLKEKSQDFRHLP